MRTENADDTHQDGRRILMRLLSVVFILAVATVSVLFFLRRDILVYDDRYGYVGVLLLTFLCNATVFAPAPSLLVAVTAAQTLHPAAVTLLSALGTTMGEMVGYLSGFAGKSLKEAVVSDAAEAPSQRSEKEGAAEVEDWKKKRQCGLPGMASLPCSSSHSCLCRFSIWPVSPLATAE